MAHILGLVALNGNSYLLIVKTAASRDVRWGRPANLSLVETTDGAYVSSLARNVIRLHARYRVDKRHTGLRSNYGATLARLSSVLDDCAAISLLQNRLAALLPQWGG